MNYDIKWKKNLYENNHVPDNYTDDTFLRQLRKNVKPNNVSLLEAVSLGASISIRLSILGFFVIIFIWLYNEWATPNIILACGIALTVLGYVIYNFQLPCISNNLIEDLRIVVVFLVFGYISSPILRTLTETISTDTIYAMTILMFIIHIIFNKYGSSEVSPSDSLSITSSIFGSLMLASRLASPFHAFSLLTASVQCFVLLPLLLNQIRKKIIISTFLATGTTYLLSFISWILCYIYIAATIFIQIICPLWYVRWQKYKDNIYGPWDEAVILN